MYVCYIKTHHDAVSIPALTLQALSWQAMSTCRGRFARSGRCRRGERLPYHSALVLLACPPLLPCFHGIYDSFAGNVCLSHASRQAARSRRTEGACR